MNKLLIVAATAAEINPLLTATNSSQANIDFLVTGVGMVATAFALGRQLERNHYDLAVNLGIGGAFNREIALGEVVYVKNDTFSELGAEDGDDFLTLTDLGFGESEFNSIESTRTRFWTQDLRTVKGITVNRVHGNESQIERLLQRCPTDVESMEGAAFYYACTQAGIPGIQIRGISNYVERRNREKWQIGMAVKNLNEWFLSKMTLA